ncbi:hypothetical protein AURDEDRAFT_115273 [Auricularia subglabra TFB-10046 SS5]|nr:hypothetical protein AURDEDRAFT_115273 [Auricularia subglabra TFB-10046 SS5]
MAVAARLVPQLLLFLRSLLRLRHPRLRGPIRPLKTLVVPLVALGDPSLRTRPLPLTGSWSLSCPQRTVKLDQSHLVVCPRQPLRLRH